MAGRPRNYSEDELIAKAMQVFWEKGYKASSAKDLMDAMDIGQGSFYTTFKGGKKELYQKTLQYNWAILEKRLREGMEQSENLNVFIQEFFQRIVDRRPQEVSNGCYVGNALVEFRSLDMETRALANHLMARLENTLKEIIVRAQEQGSLDKGKSPDIIAKCLLNLWNGANITQRVYPDGNHLKDILDFNLKALLN